MNPRRELFWPASFMIAGSDNDGCSKQCFLRDAGVMDDSRQNVCGKDDNGDSKEGLGAAEKQIRNARHTKQSRQQNAGDGGDGDNRGELGSHSLPFSWIGWSEP